MKNILDRLESVIASTDATLSRKLVESKGSKTLSEESPEYSAFYTLLKKGSKDKFVKAFLDCYERNEDAFSSDINEVGDDAIAFIFRLQLSDNPDLEIKIDLDVEPDGSEANGSGYITLDGDPLFDDIDDEVIKILKKFK